MYPARTKNPGFTLIELIVVIAIVAVLSTIGFTSYVSYIKDANDLKRISDVTLIKSQLEIYKKNHGLLYPSGSGSTGIMSGTTNIAQEYLFDTYLAGKVGIEQVPLDPKTGLPYLYSVSQDKQSYQIAATLENSNNSLALSPVMDQAYALSGDSPYTAYVAGNFIPTNKLNLPGLLYAVQTGAVFIPMNPPTFDISDPANLAKVILRGQNINIAYDMNGKMMSNDGTLSLTGVLARVTLVENTNTQAGNLSCIGIFNTGSTYFPGQNEVWPYMAGTTTSSQIGWKYKNCDGTAGTMKPTTAQAADSDWYYICATIPGATYDAACRWTGCTTGYTAVPGSNPTCKANLLAPVLSYPQNGAYGLPTAGNMAWNTVSGSNGTYKTFLGTANGTWNVASGSTTTALSYAYSSLAQGTTYYWKVSTCDVPGTTCMDSAVGSFTTASAASGTGSSGGGSGTGTVTNYCPTDPIPCVTYSGSISIAYMGCSNIDDTNLDCAANQNSFGTSKRDYRNDSISNSYFGYDKAIIYQLKNGSNGTAYFRVKLGSDTSSLVTKAATTSYDITNTVDFGGEGIADNLYWSLGTGCSVDATYGYKVLAQSSCWITVHGRSDMNWPTTLGTVGAFQVYNTDTTYGLWSIPATTVVGQAPSDATGYQSSPLTLSFTGTALKQPLETATVGVDGDFGTSDRVGTGTYGYWKSLTYSVNNPNTTTAYFQIFATGAGIYTNTEQQLKPTTSTDSPSTSTVFDPVANSGKVINISNNVLDVVGNLLWKNGDETSTGASNGSGACAVSTPNINGFSVPASSSCKITLYFRGDAYSPTGSSTAPMVTLNLRNQTITGNLPNTANLSTTKTFNGLGVGWWIYFTQYVQSEMAGWILLNLSIQDYNTANEVIRGWAQSENLGWICFDNVACGANITARNYITGDPNEGQLTGYIYSELAGWIDVGNVYLKNNGTLAGYAASEMFGWIQFTQ